MGIFEDKELNMNPIKKTITLADGREITLETGKLAKQADGAVELRMGNTMLLATVVSAKEAGEGVDFMPLQVEYKEKFSAAGRYPGGFQKREGRSSDYEILTSRLVDRVLRPLFPENYHADTFVNIIMFSSDGVDMPDALAGLAASAAIAVSDVPFHGPISEVRVARVDGEFVINPTFEQVERADIELMVGATYDNIMMVEGEMNEVSELELLEALKAAHEAIKAQCLVQMELAKEVGAVKREYCHEVNDEDLRKDVHDKCYEKAYAVAKAGSADKQWRNESFKKIEEDYLETIPEEERDEKAPLVARYYHDVEKKPCAAASSTKASVSTAVRPTKSVLSGARLTTFQALTDLQCSPVERLRLSPLVPSAQNSTRRFSTTCSTRAKSASCCTTTSLHSQQEKQRHNAA